MGKLKSPFLTILIILAVALPMGWGLSALYIRYTQPVEYRVLAKNFVFTVDPKFTNYLLAVNEFFMSQFALHQKNISQVERAKIEKTLPKVKKRIKTTRQALEAVLEKATQRYGDMIKAAVNQFLIWNKSVDIYSYPYNQDNQWLSQYGQLREKIYEQLREASGYYNIGSIREAFIMQLVPKAKEALKKNPNNPALCTVMQQFDAKRDPETIAKQIAFIDLGDQYCNQFYHEKSAWGILDKDSTTKVGNTGYQYESLPYGVYYEKYVLPMVSKAIEKFKNKKENTLICQRKGMSRYARDPEKDALRVAYRGEGKIYCPSLSQLEQRNYMNTSYICIVVNTFACGASNRCDVLERCKPMNGVLFRD